MLLGAFFATALCVAYIFTVAMIPALVRHTGDSGRLQWLPSVPGAMTALQVYAWPANRLSRIPPFHEVLEFSEDLWWTLLDPPDTTP
jgi:hypothetical protein